MREVWKLPMIIRSNANGPSLGETEVWIDPDKIVGMTKHPNGGFATLLIPQGMIDTVVSFDVLWEALPAKKREFKKSEPTPTLPAPEKPAPELETSHHHHHHS